jgi:glycerol kinase
MGIIGSKNVSLYGKAKLICLGGSWKKTYGTGTSTTWEETKGFPPTEIGGITISIKPSHKWVNLNVSM